MDHAAERREHHAARGVHRTNWIADRIAAGEVWQEKNGGRRRKRGVDPGTGEVLRRAA